MTRQKLAALKLKAFNAGKKLGAANARFDSGALPNFSTDDIADLEAILAAASEGYEVGLFEYHKLPTN